MALTGYLGRLRVFYSAFGGVNSLKIVLFKAGVVGSIALNCGGFRVNIRNTNGAYFIAEALKSGWRVEGYQRLVFTKQNFRVVLDQEQLDAASWVLLALAERGWIQEGEVVRKEGLVFHVDDDLGVVYETFELEQYNIGPELSGRLVVDVGANIGDSAIYFAKRGARVIGLEPSPSVFRRALENIALNGAENQTQIVNAALCYTRGARLKEAKILSESSQVSIKPVGKSGFNVRCVTLCELLGSEEPFLIKADCEGCEYQLFEQEYDIVRRAKYVIVEVHPYLAEKSAVESLIGRLAADYDLSFRQHFTNKVIARPDLNSKTPFIVVAKRKR